MIDFEVFKNNLIEYEKELSSYKVPRFHEIPDIDLYMDQTILFLNKRLQLFVKKNEPIITPSMINNYVKAEIIPAPKGEKYSSKHLCYIICVCFLKQVLSMNDIKNILYSSIDAKGEEFSYNFFCECIEKSFKNCCSLINVNKTDVNDIDIFDLTLYFVCKAIANKIYSEKCILLQQNLINEQKINKIKQEIENNKI